MSGALTFVEAQLNGLAGVSDLDGPRQLAISPDGAHVYVAAELGHAIVVFSRNAGTGALTFVEVVVDDVSGVDGIRNTYDVVVSPDGAHLYAIGRGDNAVAAFSRHAGTGALTFVEAQFDNPFSDRGFRDPRSVAISGDGARVFATGTGITAFERNTTTGALMQRAATYDVSDGTEDVAVSGDGAYVYGVVGAGTSLAAFRFDPVTYDMSLLHTSINGVGGVAGMTAAQTLVLTPDASQVYVNGGAGDVALFGTRQLLGVFDTATLALLSPQPAADQVAAAGERAVILTPESSAGIDLNGDADALTGGDLVAQLYDASGSVPVLTNLGVAASRIAIGSGLVALTVREVNENQSSAAGQDLNGDGDSLDDVLAWHAIGDALPPHNLGVTANSIAITGSRIVFTTPEGNEGPGGVGCTPTIPPGGCDLNGDGDALDWVLRIYRQDTNDIVNVGFDASDFVISGNYVAFRTAEDSQGSTDFNGDGGTNDSVMFVYNLLTGELINTAITSFPCNLPGCEPSIPYKVKGETVSFLTWEPDEGEGGEGSGRDRNGDGDVDVDDVVLTVYSVPSRTAQFVATVVDDYESVDPLAPSPLPTEDVGVGTIVYVTAKESTVGEDVNGDGVIDDSIVVLVTGDADKDGTFDDLDTCLTAPNPEQTDFDGDKLGDDTCDPNIECPPQPLDGCRTTTEPGKSKLTIKNSSNDSKDSLKWTWVKGGATAIDDFADPINGAATVALCVYDGSNGERRIASSHVASGGICGGEPCWSPKGTTGYKFNDSSAAQQGIKKIVLKSGASGKAKIVVKAKGTGLALRDLPATTPVVAQLLVSNGSAMSCWETRFSTAEKNDAGVLKAKGD